MLTVSCPKGGERKACKLLLCRLAYRHGAHEVQHRAASHQKVDVSIGSGLLTVEEIVSNVLEVVDETRSGSRRRWEVFPDGRTVLRADHELSRRWSIR